jgi:hypothetical protein
MRFDVKSLDQTEPLPASDAPGDAKRLTKLSPEVEKRVRERLAKANGNRRTRLLDYADVQPLVDNVVINQSPWAWKKGFCVGRYFYGSYTSSATYILVARVDGVVYIDAICGRSTRGSPGRAWKPLQPWRDDRDMTNRLRLWVAQCDPIPLS